MTTQYGLLSGEDAVSQGLGQAAGLMGSYIPSPYPSFVPSQTEAPSQQSYMNYTPNQPMAQVQTPNYQLNSATPNWQQFQPQQTPAYQQANPNAQAAGYGWQDTNLSGQNVNQEYKGLMGGDYNALQTALQTPGEIAARTAYDQGQTNLTNQMGGRGLYGSSIMSNQARNALEQPYMNALSTNAANAAAQRYGMQATDLQNQNQFGLNQALANQSNNMQLQGLVSNQGLAKNAAGLTQAQLQTGVNQQNTQNALAQANQLNALRSGDTQQMQGLMANQNLAQNAQGLNVYGQQMNQNQAMNAQNLEAAKLGMAQNQNVYQAGVSDAARQQDYNLAAQTDVRAQAEQQRQWANQQALEQMQYNLASGQYSNEQQTAMINQYLALAGRGQTTAGQNAQTAAQNAANATASQSGWLGLLGTGIGAAGYYYGNQP